MREVEPTRTRIAAYGLVVDRGRMVLCRLSARATTHDGHWTLPGGGIDFGEDPADAVVREVLEETGLRVRPVSVAAIHSWVAREATPALHAVQIVYRVEVLGGTLTSEVDGTTDLSEWHEIRRVRDLPIVELVRVALELIA